MLGSINAMTNMQPSKNAPAATLTNRLAISNGSSTHMINLDRDRLGIGRNATADIPLVDPAVSRAHAEIYRDEFGLWNVRDLGSRNGTMINGKRVTDQVLRHGDECRVGPFLLMLDGKPGTQATGTSTKALRLSTAELPSMQSLLEFPSPKIGAAHHSLITEFGRKLDGIAEVELRLEALCLLVVHPAFHGMSAMVICARRDGSLDFKSEPQVSNPHWLNEPPHVSRTLLDAVREQGVPVLASSVPTADMAMDLSVSIDTSQFAAIACPLRRDDESCDVLYATFPASFGTGEWLALTSLAARQYQQTESNLIVRQQQMQQALHEHELSRARKVQMSLVPNATRLANLNGFDVAISFEPCMQVGGDYVDACVTDDGRVLLVLADVSGKGMSAALITSMMHTMIHTLVRDGQSLAELMTRINAHFYDYLDDTMFVTAFAALIDPATGQMECVNAGHPAAVLVKADGTFQEMQSKENLPLGVGDDEMVSQQETIQTGEILIFYSDGLSETMDASGRLIGTDRVAQDMAKIIHGCGATDTKQIASQIAIHIQSLDAHATALDDRTFLVARFSSAKLMNSDDDSVN